MEEWTLFHDDWSFCLTGLDCEMEQIGEYEDAFTPVKLPHDWLIYDTENLYRDGCGWYRKRFHAEIPAGGKLLLRFDGVYMDSSLYVNGQWLMDWKYGYSTFTADLTPLLRAGENEVLVKVRYQSPNSRWYSGAGIYRNVWMKICEEVYFLPDGTYVTMQQEGEDFLLTAETELAGNIGEETCCQYFLWRKGSKICEIGVGTCVTARVQRPLLWEPEEPNLYELHVELLQGKRLVDFRRITVGFRTIAFTTDKGLFLNGRHVKLHGVCEHHDLGCLGAAFYKEALARKFRILKEMGVNAIRISHNMPAPELMELADEMGLLIVSEAFDMWKRPKTPYDYSRFFEQWAKKDVASWIRRDRNHPCLLMWSIGNEIYDTHAGEEGQELTRRLVREVRLHDPKENAPVTIGSNYMPWENARKCADIVKLAGYNYGEAYYDAHHKEHPDWVIYGSETASVVQSRGVYRFPAKQSILADEDEQCSALGNSTTSWGAKSLEMLVAKDRDTPYSLGQFLWTGFDYIGEPTPYHTKNSYFGQIDTAGFPKDSYYLFQAEWNEAHPPMIHLFPYWDFNEGQLIDVFAYTNAEQAELFLNGRSLGRQQIDHRKGERLSARWQAVYEPGVLEAKAYDAFGAVVAHDAHVSFGDTAAFAVCEETPQPDGRLHFYTISALDKEGNPVENAMDYVTVQTEGGRLLGLDNGDSTDYDSYQSNSRKLFNGKLLAVVEQTTPEIPVKVTVLGKKTLVPVRKVALTVEGERVLTPHHPSVMVKAEICPANATNRTLQWKAVNTAGIEVNFVKTEPVGEDGCRVTALGDGQFLIRCMAFDHQGKVRMISQLELEARDLGHTCLNPYDKIAAGLYTSTVGAIGNGNEKGIATARDGVSGVIYENIDFGEYGSDEITMQIFALSDAPHRLEIWLGRYQEAGSRQIAAVTYQKPSIWNVYQPETWKLPERIKGVATLSFVADQKMHIKEFCFTKYEKALCRLFAAECDSVYGDQFTVEGNAVKNIGNNVTLEYRHMDFGEKGVNRLTLWGRTPLSKNTVHIRFTKADGTVISQIAEYPHDAEHKEFVIDRLQGEGTLEFVFLPGSAFDFEAFLFC